MTGCTWYPNYKPEYPPVHPFAHFQFLDFPNKKPCKLEVLWALLLVASFAKEPYPVYNSVHPPVQPFALVIIIFWSTQVCAVILNASKKPNKIRGFLCSFVKEPCKIGALFSLFFGVHSNPVQLFWRHANEPCKIRDLLCSFAKEPFTFGALFTF